MCNNTTKHFLQRNPKCCFVLTILFVIVIILSIGAIVYTIVSNLNATFEHDSDKKSDKKVVDKDKIVDYDIDFHLRKHRDELEHRKEMEMAEKNHELTKISIILPISGIFVMALCCTLIYIYRQKLTNAIRSPNSKVVTEASCMKQNNEMKLPKSKMNDFHILLSMGFDKKEIVKSLNATETIGFALDRLTNQKSSRILQADLSMEEKERMKGSNAAQQGHGIQIDENEENYVFLGEF